MRRRKGGVKRITDSKGEKPSVSELCLHSCGGEMKMIGPAREVDVHFCARKKRKKKLQANLKLGHGWFFLLFSY